MASSTPQPLQSRRYGTIMDPGEARHAEVRHTLDELGSSAAAPPPGAMEARLTPEKPRRTLFSALDERATHRESLDELSPASKAQLWGKSRAHNPYAASPSPSNDGHSGLGRSRSFLDVYRRSDPRPWLDDDYEQEIQNAPAPLSRRTTITDVEDEQAPMEPRIRTVLSAAGEPMDAPNTDAGVPIVSATAAALAKLTNEEPPAPVEKKKKKKVVNENGEVVRKKKRDKDGSLREKKDPTRRKKRVPVRRADNEPLEEPAEMDWMDEGAPTTYLDSVRDDGRVPTYSKSRRYLPEEAPQPTEPVVPVSAQPVVPGSPRVEPPSERSAQIPLDRSFSALQHNATPPVVPVAATEAVAVAAPSSYSPHELELETRDASAPEAALVSPGVQAAMNMSPVVTRNESDFVSRAAPIAEKWRKGQLDPDAMSLVSASTYAAPTLDERRNEVEVPSTVETSRMHVFNQNASRLAINVYILYHGLFVMLRKLWRWERPWITGGVAAFYLVVWWRGDLLAIFFLLTFLYIATFRWLHLPAEETFEPQVGASGLQRKLSNKSLMRRTHRLDLVATQPLSVSSSLMLQQIGDQILIYTHGLADMQERMKNLAMWRSPLVTLRYLGWLLLLVILSAHITTWMMVKLPGALVFLCVFVVAPMIEYGYWTKVWDMFNDMPAQEPTQPFVSKSRTMLDTVLSGVPTDEEYLSQSRVYSRWENEREERRRGEYLEMGPNRIVEEVVEPRVRRRREPRTARPSRRVIQRWQDATDDVAEPRIERQATYRRPVADLSLIHI